MLRIALRLLAAIAVLAALGAGSVAPAIAGGGCHGPDGTAHTEGDLTVIRMETCAFLPTVVHVPVGTEVTFLNTAWIDHMVVGEAQSWGKDDPIVPGDEVRRTFAAEGVYPYSCPLHPGMVGAVVVGGADSAAVVPAPAGGSSVDEVAPVAVMTEPVTGTTEPVADSSSLLPVAIVGILAATIVGGGLILRRSGRPVALRES